MERMMVEHSERRTAPRADFSGITMLRAGRREIWCKAANVSECGILLYPQGRAALPDSAVHVVFTLPTLSTWIELDGRLVRQGEINRRRAWGVAFTEVSMETQTVLRDFVSRHTPGQTTSHPPPLPEIEVPTPVAAAQGRGQRLTAPLRRHPSRDGSEERIPPDASGAPGSTRTAPSCRGSIPVVDLSMDGGGRPEPSTRRVSTAEVERIVRLEEEPTRRVDLDETTGLRDRCRRS